MTKLITKKVAKSTNAKFRKSNKAKAAAEEPVEELKVTKVAKKDKKEREVVPLAPEKSKDEIRLRALRKKLKDIAELLRKQDEENLVLDNQQLIKVSRLKGLMEEMKSYSK